VWIQLDKIRVFRVYRLHEEQKIIKNKRIWIAKQQNITLIKSQKDAYLEESRKMPVSKAMAKLFFVLIAIGIIVALIFVSLYSRPSEQNTAPT